MDDVQGFENAGPLTGGIQTTGNYPGKARNFLEVTQDLDKALSYVPGSKKLIYTQFTAFLMNLLIVQKLNQSTLKLGLIMQEKEAMV